MLMQTLNTPPPIPLLETVLLGARPNSGQAFQLPHGSATGSGRHANNSSSPRFGSM